MKKEKFNHLLGKSRCEVIKEIGDGFNYFTNTVWTYEVGKTWIGKRIILSIKFKDEKASEVSLSTSFRRC
jgi:hypothetical protein